MPWKTAGKSHKLPGTACETDQSCQWFQRAPYSLLCQLQAPFLPAPSSGQTAADSPLNQIKTQPSARPACCLFARTDCRPPLHIYKVTCLCCSHLCLLSFSSLGAAKGQNRELFQTSHCPPRSLCSWPWFPASQPEGCGLKGLKAGREFGEQRHRAPLCRSQGRPEVLKRGNEMSLGRAVARRQAGAWDGVAAGDRAAAAPGETLSPETWANPLARSSHRLLWPGPGFVLLRLRHHSDSRCCPQG